MAELNVVERWTPPIYILNGIGFIVLAYAFLLGLLSPVAQYIALSTWFLLVFISLIGFEEWLHEAAPRLAFIGLIVAYIGVLGLAANVVPTLTSMLSGTSFSAARPNWSDITWNIVIFSASLAMLLFGIGIMRYRMTSKAPGEFLLMAGISLPFFFEFGTLVDKLPGPLEWGLLVGASFVAFELSITSFGVALRHHKTPSDRLEYYREEEAHDQSVDGWANRYVREGFDVDGSESRTSPLDMDTRVSVSRFLNEGAGRAYLHLMYINRLTNPLLRLTGRLIGRESAIEQYIAEKEYGIHCVRSYERGGLTTKRGILSLIIQLTPLSLLGLGLGIYLIVNF